jgi:5,10-methylenetetrahydromethanopterin reductase
MIREMYRVRFGIELVPSEAFWKTTSYGILAEKHGFDYCWVTHHYNNQDVYIILATIANYTNKIFLAPGIVNPYLSNPVAIASATVSLDKVSGGKAVLGIGAGDKTTLECLGVARKKPLATIEESVGIIKQLWNGEVVNHEGEMFKIRGASLNFKPEREIPIYIGAQGPKLLSLAGRIADGVLINASHKRDIEIAMKQIAKGAREAKRDVKEIEIAAYTCFSLDADAEKAKKSAKAIVAYIAAGTSKKVLERHGIPEEDANTIKELLGKRKFKDASEKVTDDMLDSFSIHGSLKDCQERIEELKSMEVTQIVAGTPIGPNKKDTIKKIGEKIINRS